MTTMLELPDEMLPELTRRAAERGLPSAREYVLALIDDALDGESGEYHPVDEHTDAEIEAMARKSLASGPATPFTAADWVEVRRRSQALIDSGRVR